MVKKRGLNKCHENDLKYFSILDNPEKISLPITYKPIKNILSFNVLHSSTDVGIMLINNGEYEENEFSYANIALEIEYKLIYSTPKEEKLQFFMYKTHEALTVKIPNIIDGAACNELITSNKITGEIFIEEVDIQVYNENTVLVTPYIIGNLVISPTHCLSYIMENEAGHRNIYTSLSHGEALVQRTFTKSKSYSEIKWNPYENEIIYVSSCEGLSQLCIQRINDHIEEGFEHLLNLENIHSISYTSNNHIIFSGWNGKNYSIYRYDIRINACEIFMEAISERNYIKPKWCKKKNTMFYIARNAHDDEICSFKAMDLKENYITRKRNIVDFMLNKNGDYIAYYTHSESSNTSNNLYIIYKEEEEEKITFEYEDYTIKKIMFSPVKNVLAVCLNKNHVDDIYFYYMDKGNIEKITSNVKGVLISDFTFNLLGNELYYACNEAGNYNIYMIDLVNMRKNDIVKCDSDNICFSYKGF